MIKEAVAMKLQKKYRDQSHIPAIGLLSKYRGALLLAGTFKIQHAAKKRRSDKPDSFLERL